MRQILLLSCTLIFLLTQAGIAGAQAEVEIIDVKAAHTFGDKVAFSATIRTQAAVGSARLNYQVEGEASTRTVPVKVSPSGALIYIHEMRAGVFRPFAQVTFWFQISLADDKTYESPRYSFLYDDNRYSWQVIQDDDLRLHWYKGNQAFGQSAFEKAQTAYQSLQALLPGPPGKPIHIYVYATAEDVQNTLNLGGGGWVSGHALPDLGVALVSIDTGVSQAEEMARQIPHELAHVLLFRLTGLAYATLPGWLVEGIASQAETAPKTNYAQVLATARQNQALIPLTDLCGLFPSDPAGVVLAYAQANSFVEYLSDKYGATGIRELVQAYSEGLTCEEGARRAMGYTLSELDEHWRKDWLGDHVTGAAFRDLLPYLLLLAIILVVPAWRLLGWKKRQSNEPTKSK